MAQFEKAVIALGIVVVTVVIAGCSYDSNLGNVTCTEEGLRDGDRVCRDGYWVDESDNLDVENDSTGDAEDVQPDIPDVAIDTGDADQDVDGGDCVPTTDDETTCDQVDNDCDGDVDEGLTTRYYFDADGDGFGDPNQSVDRCDPPAGDYVDNDLDCNDDDPDVNPSISEVCLDDGSCTFCNGKDDNCNGEVDEACPCDPEETPSQECFPFGSGDPDADLCQRGTQECINGTFGPCEGAVGPSDEVCDSQDNDCDGQVDEDVENTYYFDEDGDGFGIDSDTRMACSAPSDYVSTPGDCDDKKSEINPGADETCNDEDDDCDGDVDEGVLNTYYLDDDNDGYGIAGTTQDACSEPGGYASQVGDCNDDDKDVFPGANETCNGIDDDCDGDVDEGVLNTYYEDTDGDGYGDSSSTTQDCSTPSGYVDNADDCDDSKSGVNPNESESCNGIDDDCDGDVDEGVQTTYYLDDDGDMFGDPQVTQDDCSPPANYVENSDDCDDSDSSINPDASETCNNEDDDCDGDVDEGVKTLYYIDADGDTFGTDSTTREACSVPAGYSTNKDDCDDGDPTTYPGADEICDGRDNDCADGVDQDPEADDWCSNEAPASGTGSISCVKDGFEADEPCCEVGNGSCSFESTCGNGLDDDQNGDIDCADANCDGLWCDTGKVCNVNTGNCEAI